MNLRVILELIIEPTYPGSKHAPPAAVLDDILRTLRKDVMGRLRGDEIIQPRLMIDEVVSKGREK